MHFVDFIISLDTPDKNVAGGLIYEASINAVLLTSEYEHGGSDKSLPMCYST
jgi:hypothetical protein